VGEQTGMVRVAAAAKNETDHSLIFQMQIIQARDIPQSSS
jgi:hypothetical protein